MTITDETATTSVSNTDTYDAPNRELPVSEAVVLAVAEASGRDVLGRDGDGLAPLYESVDPDALDALFQGDLAGANQLTVTFDYGGYRVSVAHDGTVTVDEQ